VKYFVPSLRPAGAGTITLEAGDVTSELIWVFLETRIPSVLLTTTPAFPALALVADNNEQQSSSAHLSTPELIRILLQYSPVGITLEEQITMKNV